jgi:hypothetical protein
VNEFQTLILGLEITRQAQWAAEQWPGRLTLEDVVPGVWGHLTEDHVSTLLASSPEVRSMALRWIAARVAQTEIAMLEYFSGTVTYSIPEVWRLLNQGLLDKPREGMSGVTLDAFLDLQRATGRGAFFKHLSALAAFRGYEGVSGVARAVEALAYELNRKRTTHVR